MSAFAASISTDRRKHVLMGYYQWIVENNPRVYVEFSAGVADVAIPTFLKCHESQIQMGYHTDTGRYYHVSQTRSDMVILDIGPKAARNMRFDDKGISFGASFDGAWCDIYLPYNSISCIYCPKRQDNMRIFFPFTQSDFERKALSKDNNESSSMQNFNTRPSSHLKVIK